MKDKIFNAIKSSRADYTEIRIEKKETTRSSYRGKDLEIVNSNIDKGGMIRCLVKNRGWGIVTFNDIEDLRNKVNQAFECAKLGSISEPIELAAIEPVEVIMKANTVANFRSIPISEKKELTERYNNILLSYCNCIVDTRMIYRDNFTHIMFANSEGSWIEQEKPTIVLFIVAIARDCDNVQHASDSIASIGNWDDILSCDEFVLNVAQRAVNFLKAKPVKSGEYTVIADPMLSSVFIHEAFGHLSEADFLYENPKVLKLMPIGRRIGTYLLNVFDDGSLPKLRGYTPYDDEGTPAGRNWLIKNGEIVGRLHSRQTAAKMGEKTTGNARAVNYRYAPIVRMTNTGIDNGATSFDDMLKDIKYGIYACDAFGGQTELESFSFSAGYAWIIREGKLEEMVKDVILSGNVFTTLHNIDAVGNDFKWINAGGGCGKYGQSNLPISMGAPHIRIQNVVIGGE